MELLPLPEPFWPSLGNLFYKFIVQTFLKLFKMVQTSSKWTKPAYDCPSCLKLFKMVQIDLRGRSQTMFTRRGDVSPKMVEIVHKQSRKDLKR